MQGFVGRKKELEYLEELYKAVPQSCAVHGRVRLGKSSLLKEFCKDKPYIYVRGTGGLAVDCLRNMEDAVSRYSGRRETLEDIQDFFSLVMKVCGHKKTVLIFDHYEELIDAFPDMFSYISTFLRREIYGTRILFIACDTDSTVFGKIANIVEIKPMNYLECKGFHPDYTPMQHLKAYGMVGGAPVYHFLLKDDPDEAIRDQFFGRMSVFTLEVESMVNSEATLKSECIRILHAMASGAERFKDIMDMAEVSQGTCSKALQEMENKGFVIKESSSNGYRNSIFSFNSNLLRFYYSVITRCIRNSDFFSVEDSYSMSLGTVSDYMESVFKMVCAEYVGIHYDCLIVGKVRRTDGSVFPDIDYVALIRDDHGVKRAVPMVCRLNGEPFGMADLTKLVDNSKKVNGTNKLYMMFSGCGFEDSLVEEASANAGVVLVTLEDVYGEKEDQASR
ncbi:MAG: hypothetical protein J5674_00620 [Candidatus Methanomethylophilaceae archaeon]|nr:hypothetical protein [Candidatus Methanomethylophilaceae archaeon]